ncbi:MAG TPA: hypothetical protein VEY51_20920 [Chondromyces sp.]|nr:hypothetical protein [Chondromyces sp.]
MARCARVRRKVANRRKVIQLAMGNGRLRGPVPERKKEWQVCTDRTEGAGPDGCRAELASGKVAGVRVTRIWQRGRGKWQGSARVGRKVANCGGDRPG